eukprot:Transcript_27754.p1 GENE.Transcript_27754~~Transcript_27754.p1  ORF type:complete len:385 (+),score=173.07 Transcript_27754:142-1296(+)
MGCSSSKEDDVPGAAADKKTEEGAAQNGKPASESDIVVSMDKGTMDRVKSIFSTWDIDSAGKLELAAFTGAIVQVGPHETKILDRLKDMDIDNDGFVTQEEWLKWFTETSSALTSTDLDVIFGEMEESAESMTTVVRCTRLAAEPPTAVSDASDAGPPPLDATRKAAVEALFKAWDFEGKGGIDRLKVSATSVSFGPHKSNVLKQLESMDTDGDNIITLQEMTIYFQVVSGELTDDAFSAVLEEMTELASEAATIASCLQMAEPGVGYVEGDEAEKPTLSAARLELVTKLFGLFSTSQKEPIEISALDQITVKQGPNETKLLTDLKTMDADGDGKLTFDEMSGFFAATGAPLSDDEFELVVGEMLETCESAQLAAQLAALANSS